MMLRPSDQIPWWFGLVVAALLGAIFASVLLFLTGHYA